jgi:chromosome segregation ATPase
MRIEKNDKEINEKEQRLIDLQESIDAHERKIIRLREEIRWNRLTIELLEELQNEIENSL